MFPNYQCHTGAWHPSGPLSQHSQKVEFSVLCGLGPAVNDIGNLWCSPYTLFPPYVFCHLLLFAVHPLLFFLYKYLNWPAVQSRTAEKIGGT